MGDPSDFYSPRRPNKLTRLKVTYESGRVEFHDYSTRTKAYEMQEQFMRLPSCKRTTVLKRKIRGEKLD
jgi:hypothetical protein